MVRVTVEELKCIRWKNGCSSIWMTKSGGTRNHGSGGQIIMAVKAWVFGIHQVITSNGSKQKLKRSATFHPGLRNLWQQQQQASLLSLLAHLIWLKQHYPPLEFLNWIWSWSQIQGTSLCTWMHAKLESGLLGEICTCYELDVCWIPSSSSQNSSLGYKTYQPCSCFSPSPVRYHCVYGNPLLECNCVAVPMKIKVGSMYWNWTNHYMVSSRCQQNGMKWWPNIASIKVLHNKKLIHAYSSKTMQFCLNALMFTLWLAWKKELSKNSFLF